jgi:dethiobiotin synthetase
VSAIFVTATGTDIGKTYLAAGLIRHLRARGETVDALKPVVSGFDETDFAGSDPAVLVEALGRDPSLDEITKISPWRFAAPLSPDMAAAREGRAIDFDQLVEFSRAAIAAHRGTLLIEGVGGMMVPLDNRHTVLDWMTALDLPVLVVAGSYLGTLSHTLTALDVLSRRGLKVVAVVVSETPESTVPLEETRATLARFAAPIETIALPRGATEPPAFARIAALLRS